MPKKIPRGIRNKVLSLYRDGDATAGVRAGCKPSDIANYLADAGVEISTRTIERYLRPYRGGDSPLWSLSTANDDDARLVLPVVREVAREYGRYPTLTERQAKWVVRVRRAAPDLPPWPAYNFALEYIRCENSGESDHYVTAALAYRIWESADAARRFRADATRWGLPTVLLYGAPNEVLDEELAIMRDALGGKPATKNTRRR